MTKTGAHILIVGDEETVLSLLRTPLEEEGYRITTATTGEQALERFAAERVDLVLLDTALPDIDGVEVCRRLRTRSTVPITVLTATSEEFDKILALETGADDCIVKDALTLGELRSRIRAQLRRAQMANAAKEQEEDLLKVDDLEIDLLKRTVLLRGEQVELTYVEFEILKTLAAHPGRAYSRSLLLELVWGDSEFRNARAIDVHVSHLRQKLERDPKAPEFIFTVRYIGYKFREL